MTARLEGRVAVITGGASGIGAAVSTEVVDVTVEADVERMVDRAVSELGRLDTGVNAAGFGTYALLADHGVDEWRAVIDACLTGVMLSVKHEAQVMRDAGRGAIVNIASINARGPSAGMAAYCCAKAGMEMLTRIVAMELGPHGVRVAGIGPGFVETPLTAFSIVIPAIRDTFIASTPLGRAGEPGDIADAALFLVSDEGRWVSGDPLFVDGGEMTMGYPELAKIAARG